MSLVISNSNDITLLAVEVTFDISGTLPVIRLENLSQGDNLAGMEYAFVVKSPTTTFIHEGTLASPDETGVWTTFVGSWAWPRPFNQIEWSGAPYTFQVLAKDSDGNEYAAPVQSAHICRPNGNLPASKNTFGLGSVLVQTKCDQARIYFQDTTNTSYKGLSGEVGSSVLRVNFPMDNTGTVPDPFEINYFSSAMVPITFSGKGYQFLYTSIYDYDLGDDVHVRIKYLLNDVFGVWCNIDLLPLICEYQKLIQSIESGSCNDAEAANRKLMLINPKFSLLMIGIMQPLTGVDVPVLIEEIIAIGGFDCDCCTVATGIVPTGSNAFDGYTFTVVPLGGDVEGSFVLNGYNVQLRISDVSYIFKICEGSPSETTAFTVSPSISGDGFTKTYCLNVDVEQLAEDILTTISTNAGLVNLFNSIVTANTDPLLLVDGKCIFSTANSCDYTFTLSGIPVNTTFALLTAIKVTSSDSAIVLNYSFNLTNLPGLQTYLNSLGYGTFTVTNPSGQTVVITSVNNTSGITALKYSIASTSYLADIDSECTGYSPLTTSAVVQNIINYLCALDDSQMVTSEEYELCYIDTNGNKQTETIEAGTSLTSFFQSLTTRGCTTIDHIISLGAVNCATLKEQFPSTINVMQPDDYFLGTKENACSRILPTEAFLYMLTYGQHDVTVINEFCKFMTLCNGGLPCVPYNVFYAEVNAASPMDGTAELVVVFDHPDAVSNTIRYARIDNTVAPVYVTVPGLLPGDSPYTISSSPELANGQYRVYILPVYADGRRCLETSYDTLPCVGISAFNATYDGTNINVTYTAESTVPNVKVNLSYPNGGSFSQIYANGDTITITPPAEVYGTFFATMQPVCDNDSGWFGAATAQVAFERPSPYTVLVQVANPGGGSTNRITSVTGITGFTLPSNVTEGNYFGGYHADFTGAITVQLIQIADVSNNLHLFVNDVEVDCEDVTVGTPFTQTFIFGSIVYASTDVIRILFDNVPCDVSP